MIWATLLAAAAAAPELTFDEAVAAADQAPSVVAARQAVERRQPDDAVPATQPQLYVAPGFRATPEPDRGLEFQSSLVQQFSLAGADEAKARVGAARRGVLEAEHGRALFEARWALAEAWIRAWSARRGLEAARQESAAAAEWIGRVEKLVEAKATTRAELDELRAFAAALELAVLAAEGDLFERGEELAKLAGVPGGGPVVAKGEPPAFVEAEAPTIDRLETHPSITVAKRSQAAAQAQVEAWLAAGGAHVQAGAAFQRESPGSYIGLLAGTFLLPVWDVHRHERNESASEAALREGELAEARRTVAAGLVHARHEVEHTREVLEAVRDRVLPASEQLAKSREALFAAGEGGAFEVVAARRQFIQVRSRVGAATADAALARYRLSMLLEVAKGAPP